MIGFRKRRLVRAVSDDPAIRFDRDTVRLHVNPGRRVELHRDQVQAIHGPQQPRAVTRRITGRQTLMIETELRHWLWSSTIVVASQFLEVPLDQVAGRLRAWHGTKG